MQPPPVNGTTLVARFQFWSIMINIHLWWHLAEISDSHQITKVKQWWTCSILRWLTLSKTRHCKQPEACVPDKAKFNKVLSLAAMSLFKCFGHNSKLAPVMELWSVTVKQRWIGCPCGIMVKAMDGGILVSEFKLHLCYNIHFQANTLEKGMNLLVLSDMG